MISQPSWLQQPEDLIIPYPCNFPKILPIHDFSWGSLPERSVTCLITHHNFTIRKMSLSLCLHWFQNFTTVSSLTTYLQYTLRWFWKASPPLHSSSETKLSCCSSTPKTSISSLLLKTSHSLCPHYLYILTTPMTSFYPRFPNTLTSLLLRYHYPKNFTSRLISLQWWSHSS